MTESQITFYECLMACAANRDLVREFDRLRGTNLSLKGSGIELMIDEATGRLKQDLQAFVEFVYEFIWVRIDWSQP